MRNILCGELAQRLPQLWIFDKLLEMQYNRHFHDLFTWLKLYPKHLCRNCLHQRLTVWTQPPKIIILALMCSVREITAHEVVLTTRTVELQRQRPTRAALPCLPCICCLIQTGHPQPSCYSGPSVLWVSLPGPTGVPSDAQAGWHRGQRDNPCLLHCCCTAEPVLTRASKHTRQIAHHTFDQAQQCSFIVGSYQDSLEP